MPPGRKSIIENMRKVLIVASSQADASALAAHCHRAKIEPVICEKPDRVLGMIAALPSLSGVVISCAPDNGEDIDLVRSLRALPQLAPTPILFVMARDDAALARNALIAGATEVCNSAVPECLDVALAAIGVEPQVGRHSGRALIIEDDPDIASLIAVVCDMLGLDTDLVDSAGKALELLQKQPYQIVVSDVILVGRETGIDVVRRIRQMPGEQARVPILASSSYDDTARRLEILRSGANDYLPKPFLVEELFWRLRNLLEHPDASPSASSAASTAASDETHHAGATASVLTARETEIAEAVSQGLSDKDIAEKLGISFWTVRSHINRIFNKLDLFNRASLVKYVLQDRAAKDEPPKAAATRGKRTSN